MISNNEKIAKLKNLLEQGKFDSLLSLLKDDSFKAGLSVSNPDFMFFMYKLYSDGRYAHANNEKAKEMLNKSIQLKHPEACSEKGKNLLFGIGCGVDVPSAEDSFRQSMGCEQSRYYIAEIYLKGMSKDTKEQPFFDFKEAKEQLYKVVELKGEFYNKALIKLALIILKQNSITEQDSHVILHLIRSASDAEGEFSYKAKVILGKYFLKQLKLSLVSIGAADPVDPSMYFDVNLGVKECSGHLDSIGKKIDGFIEFDE